MKLHIFDNGLVNKSGHSFVYTTSVYKEWVRRGNETIVYANKVFDDDLKKGYTVVPLFSHYIRQPYSPVRIPSFLNKIFHLNGILNFIFGNFSYWRDLKKLDKKTFANDDIVLIHTINQSFLFAVYWWYRSLSESNLPYLVILFRFGNIVYNQQKHYLSSFYLYQFAFKLFDRLPRRSKIIFVTDSEDLAKEYGEMTRRRIAVIPVLALPQHQLSSSHERHDEITFAYLGDAADDKGYYLLPEAIRLVLSRKKGTNIKFVVQSNIVAGRPAEQTLHAKKELAKLEANITMIDRPLAPAEHFDAMVKTDVVLIPFRAKGPSGYYARTSGIFTDAMTLGKPTIVPRDTWMERQLLKYDGGGVVFEDNDAKSLSQAMLIFLEKQDELREKARTAAKKWNEYHNAQNYVDTLLHSMEFTQ